MGRVVRECPYQGRLPYRQPCAAGRAERRLYAPRTGGTGRMVPQHAPDGVRLPQRTCHEEGQPAASARGL